MRCEGAEPQKAGGAVRGGGAPGGGAVLCETSRGRSPRRRCGPVRCGARRRSPRRRILLKFDIQGKPRKKHSNPHDISSKLLSFFVVHFYIINSLFVG